MGLGCDAKDCWTKLLSDCRWWWQRQGPQDSSSSRRLSPAQRSLSTSLPATPSCRALRVCSKLLQRFFRQHRLIPILYKLPECATLLVTMLGVGCGGGAWGEEGCREHKAQKSSESVAGACS